MENEPKTDEEEKKKRTDENTDGGDKSPSASPIELANTANERMERNIKKMEELQTERANDILAGNTGGHVEPTKVDEAKVKTDKAAKFFEGSALGDAIKKANE